MVVGPIVHVHAVAYSHRDVGVCQWLLLVVGQLDFTFHSLVGRVDVLVGGHFKLRHLFRIDEAEAVGESLSIDVDERYLHYARRQTVCHDANVLRRVPFEGQGDVGAWPLSRRHIDHQRLGGGFLVLHHVHI